jgi:hypothetical protein
MGENQIRHAEMRNQTIASRQFLAQTPFFRGIFAVGGGGAQDISGHISLPQNPGTLCRECECMTATGWIVA